MPALIAERRAGVAPQGRLSRFRLGAIGCRSGLHLTILYSNIIQLSRTNKELGLKFAPDLLSD